MGPCFSYPCRGPDAHLRRNIVATSLGLSDGVIGVTIIAAGTPLLEFATSLAAVLKGRYGLSLGNIIGSDIFNVLRVWAHGHDLRG